MRISSFMYSIRQGIKNIKRNLLFSLASIGTIVSCLFLFGLFYCVIVNFRTAMTDLENTVTISVFFDEGVTDENITMIGQQIRLRDEVNTLDFISADEAWKQYAEEKFDDPQAAIDAFQGDNPLKNSLPVGGYALGGCKRSMTVQPYRPANCCRRFRLTGLWPFSMRQTVSASSPSKWAASFWVKPACLRRSCRLWAAIMTMSSDMWSSCEVGMGCLPLRVGAGRDSSGRGPGLCFGCRDGVVREDRPCAQTGMTKKCTFSPCHNCPSSYNEKYYPVNTIP